MLVTLRPIEQPGRRRRFSVLDAQTVQTLLVVCRRASEVKQQERSSSDAGKREVKQRFHNYKASGFLFVPFDDTNIRLFCVLCKHKANKCQIDDKIIFNPGQCRAMRSQATGQKPSGNVVEGAQMRGM